MPTKPIHTFARYLTLSVLAVSGLALAQEPDNGQAPATAPQPQQNPSRGWRRFGDPPPQAQDQAPGPEYQGQGQAADRQDGGAPPNPGPANQAPPYQGPPNNYPAAEPAAPPSLTIKAGTYVTVRVNQFLSSDRNQAGDAFSGTLVRPIVVDGFVVAQTGQTVGGRVAEAQKAGRVSGVSRLGLQLTDLSLVDGQQLPIQSQLITRNGRTSEGRDAAAIAGTTGLGAAVGAAADWGRGAAIGAGAGAAVGILGVLLTRGQPTIVGPESVLTFRVDAPVTVATDRAPQAFRYVEPGDYNRAPSVSMQRPARPAPYPGYAAPAPYYGYYGYPYPYYYPYYWGPGFGFYFGGRGFYGYGGGFRGGFRGGFHR